MCFLMHIQQFWWTSCENKVPVAYRNPSEFPAFGRELQNSAGAYGTRFVQNPLLAWKSMSLCLIGLRFD